MKKSVILAAVSLAALAHGLPAGADERLARFDGGIGVIPVSSGQGTGPTATVVNRNIVRGVQPAGQPWVIADLRSDVRADGRIRVDGRGLLLAGGNNIGFNGNARVFATLICEAMAPFTERSTTAAGVPLEANGDFRIEDVLSSVPRDCPSPVLLIRNTNPAANMGWFAAGIPRQ